MRHMHLLLASDRNVKLVFVTPTSENQGPPGFPLWMGSPHAPGATGNRVNTDLHGLGPAPGFGTEPGHSSQIILGPGWIENNPVPQALVGPGRAMAVPTAIPLPPVPTPGPTGHMAPAGSALPLPPPSIPPPPPPNSTGPFAGENLNAAPQQRAPSAPPGGVPPGGVPRGGSSGRNSRGTSHEPRGGSSSGRNRQNPAAFQGSAGAQGGARGRGRSRDRSQGRGRGPQFVSHQDRLHATLSGPRGGGLKILIDYSPDATTWLNDELRGSGLVTPSRCPQKEIDLDVIRISRDPRDVLIGHRPTSPMGQGLISRVAVRDFMCVDGAAFRGGGPEGMNPATWIITLTSGAVKSLRAAVNEDTGPGERYYGFGIMDLLTDILVRTEPVLMPSQWFSPTIPMRN